MTPLTPVWTDRHLAVAVAGILLVQVVLVGGTEPWPAPVIVAAAAVVTLMVSLAFDGFIGGVVGLATAAVAIAIKRLLDIWTPDVFASSVIATLMLLLLGLGGGIVAQRLRALRPADDVGGFGQSSASSLGLLTPDLGLIRVAEEVERAVLHSRPLAVLRLSTTISSADGWGGAERRTIERAIARILDSRLRETDVPFALERNELAAVMPESGPDEVWARVVDLMDAISAASFASADGTRHRLGDYSNVRIGLAFLGQDGTTARELLEAAADQARPTDPGVVLGRGRE